MLQFVCNVSCFPSIKFWSIISVFAVCFPIGIYLFLFFFSSLFCKRFNAFSNTNPYKDRIFLKIVKTIRVVFTLYYFAFFFWWVVILLWQTRTTAEIPEMPKNCVSFPKFSEVFRTNVWANCLISADFLCSIQLRLHNFQDIENTLRVLGIFLKIHL